MITAPLNLESRLRKAPKNFDALFYLNVGALVLLFVLFGSRFVMLPGVKVVLPQLANKNWTEQAGNLRVLIQHDGQIAFEGGFCSLETFKTRLAQIVAERGRVSLVVQADQLVPFHRVFDLSAAALDLDVPVSWAAENVGAGASAGGVSPAGTAP